MERILTFTKESKMDHYLADACIVWCFDSRFGEAYRQFIEDRNFNHIDQIKVAGGAKDLTNDSNGKNFILDQIEKSLHLHKSESIILMVHTNCGAYGKNFSNQAEEYEFYREELRKAEEAVKIFLEEKGIENIEIETIFVDEKGILTPIK